MNFLMIIGVSVFVLAFAVFGLLAISPFFIKDNENFDKKGGDTTHNE